MTNKDDFIQLEIVPLLGEYVDDFDLDGIFDAVSEFDPAKGFVWRELEVGELWNIVSANDLEN
jgi:hypothetical protein